MKNRWIACFAILFSWTACAAADLNAVPSFTALASDRVARDIGDSLTVLVFETSAASRASSTKTGRQAHISADAFDGTGSVARAQANYSGAFDGAGQNVRSGNLVAQLSVTVQSVAPNGDLLVAGEQLLNIDGEKTRIRLRGSARPSDITTANTIISSRLSMVSIDYDGRGFATRSARPGIIASVLNWLGLL